ncbi:S41 family peptidase [Cesiribacter sp. SM1]|uniref:S41 family peptidase n=1 Tax=Cesiribacter sp. SM1 TaxID=2861196 RepID=UPI001CD73DD8|nr:S41 family peptidase [Cesiribacter sp. SM1]
MQKNTKSAAKLPLFVFLGVAVGLLLGTTIAGSGPGSNPFNSLLKFREIVTHIDRYYVDEVNTESMVEDAINGMLEKLDPHSVYIPKEELQMSKAQLEGQFDGIGVEFNLIRDTIVVVAPLAGGPSEIAGLQPNDRIVQVDGKNVAGTNISNKEVFNLLRGAKGSKVELGVLRRGKDKVQKFTVVRDKIPQHSIAASYMVNDEVGYIKVTRFAATTYNEFRTAVDTLMAQGMQKLILDLQDNPGGYMDRAVNMADEFISGNKMIVYTDGKKSRYDSQSRGQRTGRFEEQPVIVLINEGSASASEIVAGALQDNDRALIVGRRSFGKGLVQMPIGLNDGSELRLTISRYYTPSGRSIQKPYGSGKEYGSDLKERYEHGEYFSADSIRFSDTLRYETRKGRVVYGGGGIMPDVFVPLDTTQNSTYLSKLYLSNVVNEFTLNYTENHRNKLVKMGYKEFYNHFRVTDAMLRDLVKLGEREGVEFDEEGFDRSKELLRTQVKAVMARNIWNNNGYYPIYNQTSRIFQQALQHFDQAAELASND